MNNHQGLKKNFFRFILGLSTCCLLLVIGWSLQNIDQTQAATVTLPTDETQRCNLLHYWFHEGVLTPKLNGDISEAGICANKNMNWWTNANAGSFFPITTPVTLPVDEIQRCNLLHDWYHEGVLTPKLNGDIREADKCARQNQSWWGTRNGGSFVPGEISTPTSDILLMNSALLGNGVLKVFWIPPQNISITKYQISYDVYEHHSYDIDDSNNENYLFGSEIFSIGGNNDKYNFPYNPILENYGPIKIHIYLDAFTENGFYENTSYDFLVGQESPFTEIAENNLLNIQVSHDHGPYYYVDLMVGEKIEFTGSANSYKNFSIDSTSWSQMLLQPPPEILDCSSSSSGNISTCIAKRSGQAEVEYIVTTTDMSGENDNVGFQTSSRRIRVFVYENPNNMTTVCPVYAEPSCPTNEVVYYPSLSNGCFAQPICQQVGQNISAPIQGYEDKVVVRTREEAGKTSKIFPDVNANDLGGIAADELFRRGVIGGFPDGEFKGDRPVNRAEAAKFLLLAKGISTHGSASENDNPFWDVIVSEWYGPYVVEAAKTGIIKGNPDGSFKPGNGVNTAEFLAMMSRTFGIPENAFPHSYKDASKDPGAWFWVYAGIAEQFNLFPDRIDYLNPVKPLTRNEVAIAIYQYLKNR